MDRLIILGFWLVLAILTPVLSEAAVYYIDYVGGNEGNAGTSTGAAWKYCPGDSRSARTPSGGNTYIFKGNTVYQFTDAAHRISTSSDGSSTNRIVFDGDSGTYATRWASGSAKAIIDGDDVALGFFDLTGDDYITINNFELRYGGHGNAFIRLADSNGIIIKNMYIHHNYDYDMVSAPNLLGSYFMSGTGFNIDNSSNVLIDTVEVTRTSGTAVSLGVNSSNVEIKNFDFHDYINWGIDVAVTEAESLSNIFIHDGKIRNFYHYSQKYWRNEIPSEMKNGSTAGNPHQNGIFIRQPGSTGVVSNIRIYNVDFYNDIAKTEDGGTSWIFTSQLRNGSSVYIYNNTFQTPYPNDCLSLGWNQNTGYKIYVYHNTFALSNSNAIQHSVYLTDPDAYQHHYKNNIFYIFNGNTGCALNLYNAGGNSTCAFGTTTSDYNLFDVGVGKIHNGSFGGITAVLSTWQSGSGEDAHSTQGSALLVNPLAGASSPSSDLRIQAGSAARGAAKVLDPNTYPGSQYDKNGVYRGASGANCDIGAYQYTGAEPPPGDTTPPVISNTSPTSNRSCNPGNVEQVTLSFITDENATCRMSETDTTYALMTDTFTNTGGTIHNEIKTLSCAVGTYNYYIRCIDNASNANTSSALISFDINPLGQQSVDFTGAFYGGPHGLSLGSGSLTLTLE